MIAAETKIIIYEKSPNHRDVLENLIREHWTIADIKTESIGSKNLDLAIIITLVRYD